MHTAQAGVPVPQKPEQATDATRSQGCCPVSWGAPIHRGRHLGGWVERTPVSGVRGSYVAPTVILDDPRLPSVSAA